MVPGLPRPPNEDDSSPAIRSLEELMAAPAAPDPEAGLSARGEMLRRAGESVLAEARRQARLLREGGA